MAIGYICPCCGQRGEREESADNTVPVAFLCSPCIANPVAPPPDMSVHTIPMETSVVCLEATEAFNGLTPTEQSYAAALGKADWEGAKICLLQCSFESAPIFCLFQLAFSAQRVSDLIDVALSDAVGLSREEVDKALMYAASFYGNVGNYKSFGDTKFVPDLPAERMWLFLQQSKADPDKLQKLWSECCALMYSLPPRQRQMGMGQAKGISTYFSNNCEEVDADIAGRFLESKGISPYNTRLLKKMEESTSKPSYTILIASSVKEPGEDPVGKLCGDDKTIAFEGCNFTIHRGDHSPLMGRVATALRSALPHVANDKQKAMVESLIESFEFGSIDAHKNASRHWIKDRGPAVESYIGFIESYRDPSGVRGEWEGFVACVNREVSKKFQTLVDSAETFLKKMPWSSTYEKDVFLRPDFTSLEVLSFGSSGVPAGINIPNYDDIRQTEGFKNVSLGNVLAASYAVGEKPVTFVSANDQELFKKLKAEAFEVQVGIHELLGHGSGKLFHQGTPDAETLIGTPHPLDDSSGTKKVTGPFYATGATWDTTFGKIASTYEECRAECSGLHLCNEPDVLTVFGHGASHDPSSEMHDIAYINWLLMARAGLTGLEFYTPETDSWRQAHMQARYVILRVLLEATEAAACDSGTKLLELKQSTNTADGKPDIEICLDRSLIPTVGRKAISAFLLKLQTHKSLADLEAGSTMYKNYSAVPSEMAKMREIVMARKEPRKLLVQSHMEVVENSGTKVSLRTFAASPVGMVESFIARFPAEDPEFLALYEKEKLNGM